MMRVIRHERLEGRGKCVGKFKRQTTQIYMEVEEKLYSS